MDQETSEQRSKRIMNALRERYSSASVMDMDGNAQHFVCEVDPATDHPAFDRAIEVIFSSKPHKHIKATQHYKILSGTLELHVNDNVILLHKNDSYIINPGEVHWAKSVDECWVEIYSEPGWTKEDHVPVNHV